MASERKIGPKEEQLRNLKASKAAKRAWKSRKLQRDTVQVLRKQVNRKPGSNG